MFNLNKFILEDVIKRNESMFLKDIELNNQILKNKIVNKEVLVIGGGGSIGSSYIKAILPFRPKALVVVDINENALAELTRDLRSTPELYLPEDYVTYPMDFASRVFQKMYRNRKGFDIIANFSAHKHVRSEKDIYSIEALLLNNVINAKKLLELIAEFPPEEYFCVSTDKAANPVNIMGASKRIMEDLIFSYSDQFLVKTARFANVAFSNGSLLAGYIERLNKKQPLSAPLDIKRYFVSPEESGQICMLSCILGNNREIFFPKLRETQMMSFDKIAEQLLKKHGYKVKYCFSEEEAISEMKNVEKTKEYPVYFSKSNTSGEKEYEEFFTESEFVDNNRFNSLGVIMSKDLIDKNKLNIFLKNLENLFKRDVSKKDIINLLKEYLHNFNHIEKNKSLDSKM